MHSLKLQFCDNYRNEEHMFSIRQTVFDNNMLLKMSINEVALLI